MLIRTSVILTCAAIAPVPAAAAPLQYLSGAGQKAMPVRKMLAGVVAGAMLIFSMETKLTRAVYAGNGRWNEVMDVWDELSFPEERRYSFSKNSFIFFG